MRVDSVEQFTKLVSEYEAAEGYARPQAYGVGLATYSLSDFESPERVAEGASILDTWYPAPNCDENFGTAAILAKLVGHRAGSRSYRLSLAQLEEAPSAFTPFANDGKLHPNGMALEQLRSTLRRLERDVAQYHDGERTL